MGHGPARSVDQWKFSLIRRYTIEGEETAMKTPMLEGHDGLYIGVKGRELALASSRRGSAVHSPRPVNLHVTGDIWPWNFSSETTRG